MNPKILIFRGHYSFKKDLYGMEVTGLEDQRHICTSLRTRFNSSRLRFLKCKEKPSPNLGGRGCDAFQHDIMGQMFSAKSKNTIAVDNYGEGGGRCGN